VNGSGQIGRFPVRVLEAPLEDGALLTALVSSEEYLATEDDSRMEHCGVCASPEDAMLQLETLGWLVHDFVLGPSTEPLKSGFKILSLEDSICALGRWADVRRAASALRRLLVSASPQAQAKILGSPRLGVIQGVCHAILDGMDEERERMAREFALLVDPMLGLLLFTVAED
jgi:hypothetical protein